MSSYYYNRKHSKDLNADGNFGTSLAALNDAWSSVAATKQELRNVSQRIRESVTSPVNHRDGTKQYTCHNLPPPPSKDERNQNIERRVVYETPQQINFRKENIPPTSYPQPNLNYYQFTHEGHKNVQTYVAKESTEHKRNTSLSGRGLLSKEKKSDALKRLKDKINQQKLNSTNSSINEQEIAFPDKIHHTENDVLIVNKDDEIPHHQMTRKIAHAPSAPTYTGFNQPDATFVKVTSPKRKTRKVAGNSTTNKPTKNKGKISPKVSRKSGKAGKNQRVIAPKKPASSIITTSSWRVGQEIERKVKKEIKKNDKKQFEKITSERKSEATNITETVTDTHRDDTDKSDDKSATPKISKDEPEDMKADELLEEKTSGHSDSHTVALESLDSELSERKDDEEPDLKINDLLPKAAKDILEELEIDGDVTSPGKKKTIKAVVDTGLTKKPKSPSVKRKLDEVICLSKKERHYDQSEVKKYMMKQQAERKRRRIEQQEKEKKQKEEKELKLRELFKKQKKAVKESSVQRRKHELGHTFTRQAWKPNKDFEFKNRKFADGMFESSELSSRLKSLPPHLRKDFGVDPVTTTTSTVTSSSIPIPSDSESDGDFHFTVDEKSEKIDLPGHVQDVQGVKADRVAAIRETAAALRERLMVESKRLTDLVQCRQKKRNDISIDNDPESIVDMHQRYKQSPTNFPGIENLDSQAELNERLNRMDIAAKKIQAVYRGYNVRQNLRSWQLPSGRTLHQTLEEARRRAFLMDINNVRPVRLASDDYEAVKPEAFNRKPIEPEKDESMASQISDALESSKLMLKDAQRSLSSVSQRKSASAKVTSADHFPSYSTYSEEISKKSSTQGITPFNDEEDDHKERLRKVLEKYKDEPSDKYSVINIFARNYPSLTQQQLLERQDKQSTLHTIELTPNGTETEELLADAHAPKEHDTSNDEFLSEQTLSDDENLLQHALSPTLKSPQLLQSLSGSSESLNKLDERSKSPTHSRASYRNLLSPKSHHLILSPNDSDSSEKLFSPRSPSPPKHQVSNHTPPLTRPENNLSFSTDDSRQSASLFSEHEHHEALDPILTSTKRSPKTESSQKTTSGDETPLTRNVNYGRGCDRMSPNALERRLRAELNLFDSVGDSLQQINEMDRIRDIVQAQQETVSLAQVLKNRQVQHQKDLDRMSIEAREKAAQSAQEIERAKRVAAEAESTAQKVIAEVKNKAAENIADSAKQFSKNQNEATNLSLQAIRESEQVRRDAFETYKKSIDDRLSNVGGMMTAAASAASTAAVEVALKQHREKLEALRLESLSKVTKSYTASFTDDTSSSRQTSSSITSRSDSTLTQDDFSDKKKEIHSPISEISDEAPKSRSTSKVSRTAKSPTYSVASRTVSSKSSTLKKSAEVTDGIPEDLPSAIQTEDRELTEALFSSGKKEESKNDTSIRSNYSDEKFHSSFTEDELKHDFRQVLPSENHRRKSLDHHRDYMVSGNETSSDELMELKGADKWSKKRSHSPFVDEDTFTRFTSEMVRQYVQEEEVRSKHQAALLGLREKALVEKTKAELAYLEMQRKSLKKKGADEKMPPITKKQRALMLKLESEQAEIRRIKEAFKAASNERKFMLQQEHEIQRMRQTTKKIWNEVGDYKSADVSQRTTREESDGGVDERKTSIASSFAGTAGEEEDIDRRLKSSNEISEDLPSAASKSPHTISEISTTKRTSTTPASGNKSGIAEDQTDDASHSERTFEESRDDPSSLSKDLKKLKYMAGKKYLTEREMKLQTRKQQFSEIMNRKTKLKTWRQKIIEEEMKLKADIRKVLDHGIMKTDETSGRESGEDSISNEFSPLRRSKRSTPSISSASKQLPESKVASTVGPDTPASSIAEDLEADKVEDKTLPEGDATITEAINESSTKRTATENSKRPSMDSYNYSNDFESSKASRSSTRTLSQQKDRRKSDDDSWTEGTSDASDTEVRLKALEVELRKRRAELQKLRKKNEKEKLRLKEQELRRELQAVEQQINKENISVDVNIGKVSTPRVLSPRSSLDSIILPEKIKIPSERDSRRSLDFSDKENDSDRTVSSRSSKGDLSYSPRVSSIRSAKKSTENTTSPIVRDNVLTASPRKEKEFSERSSASGKLNEKVSLKDSSKKVTSVEKHSDSIEELSDISLSKDQSDTSVDESIKHAPAATDSIAEEISTARSGRESKKSINDIYQDDFFESDSSTKRDDELSISLSSKSPSSKTSSTQSTSSSKTLKARSMEEKISEKSNVPQVSKTAIDSVIEKTERDLDISTTKVDYSEKFESLSGIKTQSETSSSLSIAEDISKGVSEAIDKSERSARRDEIVIDTRPDENKTADEVSIVSGKISSQSSSRTSITDKTSSQTSTTSTTTSVQPPPQDDFSKSNVSSALGFRVNDRVLVEGTLMGTIRYLGKTSFSPVLVAGIELDEAMGTNDGTFHDKKYFNCAPDHGFFTTIERLQIFKEESKKESEKRDESQSTSSVEEIDESLDLNSIKEDIDDDLKSLSDKHELSLGNQSKQLNEQLGLLESDLLSDSKSSSSSSASSVPKSTSLVLDNNAANISDDDEESLSIEIPSPSKLNIQPLADKITDSILQGIIRDSIKIFSSSALPEREREHSEEIEDDIKSRSPRDSISPVDTNETVDNVTKTLLNDAVSLMIKVGHSKERKLSEETNGNFLSLIVPDELDNEENEESSDKENENENLLSAKINQLKSVHDQLGMLLGDDDDIDNDIIESISKEQIQDVSVKEEPIQIPFNENDTKDIVTLALQEINQDNFTLQELERLIVPDSILALPTSGEVDEPSTMLYKTLIFDLTLQLFYESKEFRDLQSKPRAPWLKRPRKTFSKFTRKAHLNETEDFSDMIMQHVSTCVGLQPGRPSLVQFKRKLPLNLEKKDYVDAILVDELRQEEGQWINYDEDELRVKYQLADTILEGLLEETVDIINKALS